MEIKKCQQELDVVNEHNQHELNKLRTSVAKDLRRQDVKLALDKVDNQVQKKIIIIKLLNIDYFRLYRCIACKLTMLKRRNY